MLQRQPSEASSEIRRAALEWLAASPATLHSQPLSAPLVGRLCLNIGGFIFQCLPHLEEAARRNTVPLPIVPDSLWGIGRQFKTVGASLIHDRMHRLTAFNLESRIVRLESTLNLRRAA